MRGSWVLLVLIGTLQAHPELVLRVTDQQGVTVTTVQQGEPFVLSVTVIGDINQGEPHIEHCEKCAVFDRRPVMTSVSLVNGQQSSFKKYSYTARIDALGQYALGPAVLVLGNQRIGSNAVTLNVVKPEPQQVVLDENKPIAFASVDKRQAYVGEQIVLTVRLCFNQEVKQVALQPFALSHMTAQPSDGATQEPYTYAGRQWQSVVYHFVLCAQRAGAQLVPRISVHCQTERQDTSFFSHFFGNALETVHVHTMPIELTIKPLPSAQPVDGVGQFSDFRLAVNRTTLSATKGAILTLSVTGKGCMNTVLSKPLQDVPAGLLLHESTSKLVADLHREGFATKTHEWVVQGVQPGVYTIPAQQFIFFDPIRDSYGTLSSKALTLTVLTEHHEKRAWPALPWWLFVMLAVVPFAVLLLMYGWWYFRILPHYSYAQWWRQVSRACRQTDANALYHAFVTMAAHKMGVGGSAVTTQQLIDFGEKMFNTKQQNDQWRRFIAYMQQVAFSPKNEINEQQLFMQALVWSKLIKEYW